MLCISVPLHSISFLSPLSLAVGEMHLANFGVPRFWIFCNENDSINARYARKTPSPLGQPVGWIGCRLFQADVKSYKIFSFHFHHADNNNLELRRQKVDAEKGDESAFTRQFDFQRNKFSPRSVRHLANRIIPMFHDNNNKWFNFQFSALCILCESRLVISHLCSMHWSHLLPSSLRQRKNMGAPIHHVVFEDESETVFINCSGKEMRFLGCDCLTTQQFIIHDFESENLPTPWQ